MAGAVGLDVVHGHLVCGRLFSTCHLYDPAAALRVAAARNAQVGEIGGQVLGKRTVPAEHHTRLAKLPRGKCILRLARCICRDLALVVTEAEETGVSRCRRIHGTYQIDRGAHDDRSDRTGRSHRREHIVASLRVLRAHVTEGSGLP